MGKDQFCGNLLHVHRKNIVITIQIIKLVHMLVVLVFHLFGKLLCARTSLSPLAVYLKYFLPSRVRVLRTPCLRHALDCKKIL